jgi:transcriptional regulator with XRE-family HTH domain
MKGPLKVFSVPNTTAGDIIKAFRGNFEVSQEDMAWACGISQGNLSAIENGRGEVGPKVAVRIAAFLDVHPSVLLFPNGYETLPEFKEVSEKRKKIG